ncbi:esterase/lipase superfamily enzyme [Loktanella sp. PT4BL]|nr:esterase/lipase superfamily enzyme [Loktanella sp. PT4BL]
MPTPCGRAQSRPTPSFQTSLFGILAILLLAGCAGRPTLLPPQEESFGGETVPVYFVTTRAPSGTPEVYSGARALSASYGRVDVGIPTDRTLGTLPTTDGRPNPSRHFHQNGIYRYQSFAQMRDAALTSSGGMGVSLFVHGYNNTFAESLFRLAQLHHDADQTGAAIAFQWASLGDPRAYVHDRDSALHARQTLAATIERLSQPSPNRLRLGAHSMGSLLLMEALVRLSLEGKSSSIRAIDEVVLISPDIDLGLFAQQLAEIDLPPSRFSVVINREDRLLRLSSAISGGNARVGASPDVAALRNLGVQVFDLTGLEDGDRPGHFLPATSPLLLSIMRTNSGD